jgi:hypothetical protein
VPLHVPAHRRRHRLRIYDSRDLPHELVTVGDSHRFDLLVFAWADGVGTTGLSLQPHGNLSDEVAAILEPQGSPPEATTFVLLNAPSDARLA